MGGSINYHSAEILIKWNLLTINADAVKSSKCQKYFFQDAVDPTELFLKLLFPAT